MRLTLAAILTALVLGSSMRPADAMPLALSAGVAPAIAPLSALQEAAYFCRRSRHWGERCWWYYSGPNWPPTWRGSGWRGPGWYGPGWRKEYFAGSASR